MVFHTNHMGETPPLNPAGLEVLEDLVIEAEAANVVLALENVDLPRLLDYVYTNISSDSLGLRYDSSQDYPWGRPFCEIL